MGSECALGQFFGPAERAGNPATKMGRKLVAGVGRQSSPTNKQKLGARSTTPKTKIRRFRNCAHGAGGKFCALAAAGMKKAAQKIAPKTKPETVHFAGQSGTLLQSINGAVASKMFARTNGVYSPTQKNGAI